MPDDKWIQERFKKSSQDPRFKSDLHGTGDHFHVRVISDSFDGCYHSSGSIPILSHFMPFIKDGSVHALDLKCMTKEQAEALGDTVFDPHGEGEKQFLGVHRRRNV